MKGREALRELLAAGKPKEPPSEEYSVARPSGAVKAMNLGLQRLSDEAAAAKSLRASLAAAEQVVELSPGDVEVSFIRDRIPIESDPGFEHLKEAILANGQQVPILVRPHPDDPKRFQAAYGHRRLRAAEELGLPIKAIVRKLTDAELVVAQGQENSGRRDLSFIERAVFASHLEERGFDRDTITGALAVDKPELSRLLAVVAAVDIEVIMAIGPAPKIGRPRWLQFGARMADPIARRNAEQTVASVPFQNADSNARFSMLFVGSVRASTKTDGTRKPIVTPSGKRVAWMEKTNKGVRLLSDEKSFAAFLEHRLPDLLREFEKRSKELTNE